MRQCTTSPQKRRRTQEALIREGDKSDAALCIKLWKRCRRTTPDRSIREFAKRIGEEESTVRNILNKGTTAGRLTYWLPDQKKRGYFDLSPAFAAEEPEAEFVEEPPMTEQEGEPDPRPEAEVPETDTVQVDETVDEGEELTGEGALGEEPEAAQPEQQPEAVQPQAETPPPPPQGGRKPRKGQVQQGEELRPEQAETGKKPAGAMSVAEAILDKHPQVEQIPVEGIEVNKAIRQFKRGADLKTGVVPESRLEGQWSGSLGRAIRVIEFKDGRREVITGRHRLDLARRNGMETIPAIVYREADGMTVEKAHALDAIENVMDGKGTTRDYIRFFTETSDLTDAELRDLGVTTSNNERVRNAFDIARKGIDELRVEALNAERIPLSVLGAIARSDERVQLALLDDVRKHDTRDPTQVMMMGKLLAQGIQNGETEQLELFGEDDEAMRDMRALAIGVARVTSQMRKDLSIVRGVINKEKDVVLRDETAKRLGITDKNDMAELHHAKERLEQEIREYESPTISGERRERAMKIGREALKKEEAKGIQGTLDFSGGGRGGQERPKQPEAKKAPEAKPEPAPAKAPLSGPTGGKRTRSGQVMPGESLEPVAAGQPAAPASTPTAAKKPTATARPAQALQDGETDANGFTRWHGFWVKPGTRDGEEGFYLYDKPERYAVEKAFINKKPYVTKKGISRPGRVTVLSDDRDSAKRVRALYDWVERDKPKAQEPKRRPFEDDSIINKDALKDPKTLKAVADIFDKADRRTVVASEEGDVRVEYDVSENGKPVPGTTRVLDKGRVMITDFAIDPKLGLDGSLSRTKKWIEGLKGGPKDTLAIYVNPETKAVRFTGRGAERVSQGNGIDLEEVVPRMNREGIPVIVMIGNRANVAWPGERPSEQEAPVSAPEAKPQETPTATPEVRSTPADKRKENEKRGQKEPSSVKARLEDAGLEDVEMDSDGKLSFARVGGTLGKGRIENISREVKALLVKEGMAPENSITIELSDEYWTAWDESADVLTDMIPGLFPSTRAGRHFVAISKRTDGDPSAQFVSGGHTVIKLLQRADDPKSWNVHVDRPANTRPVQQLAQATKPTPEPNVKHQTQQTQAPAKPKVEGTQAEQEALDELNELLGDIGMLREGPNVEETSDSGSSQPHDDSLLRERAGVGRAESLSTRSSITNPITRLQEKIVWLEHAADTLVVPGAQRKAVKLNAGNFIFTVSDALDLEKARNTNSHYGDFVPLEQRDGTMIGLRISDHPIGTRNAEGAAVSNRLSIVVSKGRVSRRALEPSDAAQVVEYRYNRAMLDDGRIKALLSDLAGYLRTGEFANRSRGNLVAVAPMPRTGMLREGAELTPDQRTKVQNAMNKVVAASVETAGVRTFRDLAKRLYGMLRDANRKLWEAMKPLLRAAWVGYGDTHEDLNLDEPSRAEARAIFDEVERGDAEAEASSEQPEQPTTEPQQSTEPTASEPTPQARSESQAEPTQPQVIKPTEADYANAKDGDVIKAQGANGKRAAVIKWGEYWLEPAKRTVKVWVQERRGRGRYEQQEREGVNIHGRARDGRPIAAVYSFWEPRDEWTSSKGKTHYGYLHDVGGDTGSWSKWNALDSWGEKGMPGLEDARAWIAGATPAGSGTLETTETQGKEADNERTGIQSTAGEIGGTMGGQEPSGNGGNDLGGAGQGVPGRPAPESGGADVSAGLADEQPSGDSTDDGRGAGGRADEHRTPGGGNGGATVPVQSEGGRGSVGSGSAPEPSAGEHGRGGAGAAQGVQPPAQEPGVVNTTPDVPATENFVIAEDLERALSTPDRRIRANVEALRLIKQLEREVRQATPSEQLVLSRYTGWGSLGEQFFNESNPDWAAEREELKGILSEEEWATARRTVQYAHYTPIEIARAMWGIVERMGAREGNLSVFEAGLGVGRFIGTMPSGLRRSRYSGVEMDPLSAAIARQLYPKADILTSPYQKAPAPRNRFDLIIGNPPYASLTLSDANFPAGNGVSLHNFFIMKQIEALRPGGVAVFLVTHGFMDARNETARKWIAERADLLDVVRMPDSLFKSVDARVVTDIVVFRKRDRSGEAWPNARTGWVEAQQYGDLMGSAQDKSPLPILGLNALFELKASRSGANPHTIGYVGERDPRIKVTLRRSTRYGRDSAQTEMAIEGKADGAYIDAWLGKGNRLAGAFVPRELGTQGPEAIANRLDEQPIAKLGGGATHPSLMEGGHFVGADGKLYLSVRNASGTLSGREVKDYDEKAERAEYARHPRMTKAAKGNPSHPIAFDRWKDVQDAYEKLTPKEQAIVKTLVRLREVRFDLAAEEMKEGASDERMEALRKQLNEAYDAFVEAARGYAGGKKKAPTLNDPKVAALMYADPASSQLLGLELVERLANGRGVKSVTKNAIFTKRVNKPAWKPQEYYDSAVDAMLANLALSGKIDLPWIAGRIGKSEEETLRDLEGRLFIDPGTGQPVVAEAYLSGDVKTKLTEAETAVASGETRYEPNVEALRKVQPEDIPIDSIKIALGSPIIEPRFIQEFFVQVIGAENHDAIHVFYETARGTWKVDTAKLPVAESLKWPGAGFTIGELMQAALNNRELTVRQKVEDAYGNEHTEVDKEATDVVNGTIKQIRDAWDIWWKTAGFTSATEVRKYREAHEGATPPSDAIGRELARIYNDRFNRIVDATYDGAFLKFTGLNPAITPYKHQRDAVWRTILTNNALYNHVVGSGKTNTAILSVMEMRRMGRVRKPVIVVPNHLVEQWKKEFLEAYPGANVLAAGPEDFQAYNRRRFFGRIQNGDYDAIIVPHSQITRIPLQEAIMRKLVAEQVEKYRKALEKAKESGEGKMTIKRIEELIEKLNAKIDALINRTKTDKTGMFLDTLGIDALFLDESHEFKNVPFVSSVQAKGMGNPGGAVKAFDLLMKINYFRRMKRDAPVVFMSGTPVSNSLTELYLNMLYMAPDLLERAEINSMDAFIQMFGEISAKVEPTLTGAFEKVTRFRRLVNVPELMHMVRSYMDVVDAEDLRDSMEAVGKPYSVPTIEGGRPKLIVAKRSEEQEWYFGKVLTRTQDAKTGEITKVYNEGSIYYRAKHLPRDPREDNMLKIINDAQMAALDMRLRRSDAPDFAGSKVNLCVAQIVEDYKRFDAVKGTQMVFCDRSIPGSGLGKAREELAEIQKRLAKAREALEAYENDQDGGIAENDDKEESPAEKVARLEGEARELIDYIESGGFSVYDDIKKKLVAAGIPAEEIAFIHSAKDKNAKLAMFKKMNEGKIRVLLGSTSRMGAGTNANKRMVSLHHLDAPWRPSDMEQREGRILRQGNLLMNEIPDFQVRIYRYGTEKTGDGGKYNILEQKSRALHRIYKANSAIREIDDVSDDASADFNQMVAALSGSVLEPLKAEMLENFEDLDIAVKQYNRTKQDTEDAIENYGSDIEVERNRIGRLQTLKGAAQPKPDDKKNYYAGIEIVPKGAAPQTFSAATIKERMATPGAKTFMQILEDGGDGSVVHYRGLTWTYHKKDFATRTLAWLSVQDASGNALGKTTDFTYERLQAGTIQDSSIIVRMDNVVDNADKAITKSEAAIRNDEEAIAKLKAKFDGLPDQTEQLDRWLAMKREIGWLEKAIEAGCETAKEAKNYFDKSHSGKVPDYDWTKPEFDAKMGRGEGDTPTQTGTLREAALHDETWQNRQLAKRRAKMEDYRNAKIRQFYDDVHRIYNDKSLSLRERDKLLSQSFVSMGKPNDRLVEGIQEAEGFNPKGYDIRLYGNHAIHLWKRHGGGNGSADSSMSTIHDVEMLGYLFQHFDSVGILLDDEGKIVYNKNYLHKDGTHPKNLVLSARINGVFYSSILGVDSKKQEIRITSAYKGGPNGVKQRITVTGDPALTPQSGKNEARGGTPNVTSPGNTSETGFRPSGKAGAGTPNVTSPRLTSETALPSPDTTTIPNQEGGVKGNQTGSLREGRWEKRLREELAAKGLTESDLSPEAQAYLRAKREREAVLPQGGLRGAVDKLGDLAGRREGESRSDFLKRKAVAAADLANKKLVDVRAPLIKAQREIVGKGVELAEDEDVAKAMSLSYGRIVSRHADIDRDFVKPAMKLLSQNGLDVSDLDLYLQATFAPERNRMIRERAEWKDAGAGISDEEAATRLKGMRERLTDTQWQALKEAAGHIYRMNRANLNRLAESGILSGEQVAEWLKLSPHYVPLRDDLERLGVEEPGTGGGLRKGGPFRKAVGRYSEAMDSSVGWSVIQAKQGVIWAEQNRIARVTLNFAQNHRSPDDYFVGKVPLKAEKVFRERKGYRQEDAMALRLDKPAQRDLAEQYLKAGYTVVRSSENRNVVWVDAGVRSVGGRVGWAWRNTCTRR